MQRVAGLNGTTAKNVVSYREENGAFTSRAQIKKVPKLGPKAFQQCAGFLRVPESRSVLDNTAVHPESYDAAKALLDLTGHTLADVKGGRLADLPDRVKAYGEDKAAGEIGVGVPTLRDIVSRRCRTSSSSTRPRSCPSATLSRSSCWKSTRRKSASASP